MYMVPVWSKAPAIRLLVALIAGILIQWYFQLSFPLLLVCVGVSASLVIVYSFLPVNLKYRISSVNGIAVNGLLAAVGAILIWLHDVRHNTNWIGKDYKNGDYVIATLENPLTEKTNTYSAVASVQSINRNDSNKPAEGNILIYFKKDSSTKNLHYGSQIVFSRDLQEIKNSGNPGTFDYNRYCLFNGITHQVYLTENDFKVLPRDNGTAFNRFIFSCRNWVVTALRKNISGDKEQGLAEALLIGYKNDLDKNLVQAYTNTGVVHIIAISGSHLALIYAVLMFLTLPLRKKKFQWSRLILILAGLWLFSFLVGGGPSIIRSAVMFSFIALGKVLDRKAPIYNSLALSAFCLLCYNPFWLWDVGFQLSYAAVLSIVLFFRPIYNWYPAENKIIQFVWGSIAVSISAQILTLPLSIYHFHQMPLLFLFTNLVAVPLSGVILIGEIIVCAISFVPAIAIIAGKAVTALIHSMNGYIEQLNNISFAVWNGLYISTTQAILFTLFIIAACYWLMEKKKFALHLSLVALLLFIGLRSLSLIEAQRQKKIIVYNVPKFNAIDLVDGTNYNFIGDSDLLVNETTQNFYLQPCRIMNRTAPVHSISNSAKDFTFQNKHIVILNETKNFLPKENRAKVDILVLAHNPKLYISRLVNTFDVSQFVIDGSVPAWKAKLWQHDCDSLHIPCYNVSEKGAFIMSLN